MHSGVIQSFKPLITLLLLFALVGQVWAQPTAGEGYTRGLLGVQTADGRARVAGVLGSGAEVQDVTPDLPAAAAGLRQGDIIMAVDDDIIRNSRDLQVAIGRRDPRTDVQITWQREGELYEQTIQLASWNEWLLRTPGFGRFLSETELKPVNLEMRRLLEIPPDVSGLAVVTVSENSLFSRLFERGMVILAINGTPVREYAEFMGHSKTGVNRLLVWEFGRVGTIAVQGY